MRKLTLAAGILLTSLLLSSYLPGSACSMYKVTQSGKTMVGCNHDTWNLTPRIWFETEGHGAGFTGARLDGAEGFAPQSGMNEYGLTFSRLAAATPESGSVTSGKKQILKPTTFLKDVLHRCKTVEDVKTYIDKYDHSTFIEDVFIYIDSSGNYLIVEPYSTTLGYDSTYVLANFCPSQISDFGKIKQERYRKGKAFLQNKIDTSLAFCKALSDTMHVCRAKIGDGTLLTSIWDLNERNVRLYFYHDYKHEVRFNLKEELSKGDHIIDALTLFPPNVEFTKLAEFKTPLNSPALDYFLRMCFLFFSGMAFYFLLSYFRSRKKSKYAKLKLAMIPLSIIMAYYMFVLGTTMNVFYFPAPYADYKFSLLTVAAYIPFLILLLIIPLINMNRKVLKDKTWGFISKGIYTINNITYLVLIVLFTYWGLYNIFN